MTAWYAAVLGAVSVALDFDYGTARQALINGMSRSRYFLATALGLGGLALGTVGVQLIVGAVGSWVMFGSFASLTAGSWLTLVLFVEVSAFLWMGAAAAFLTRSAPGAIALTGAAILLEPLARLAIPAGGIRDVVVGHLPVESLRRLTRAEGPFGIVADATIPSMNVWIWAAFYLLLFMAIGFWVVLRRDF